MPYHAETIVVGCGNILFKDDGFGPFVIHKLEEYFEDKEMPDEVMFIDAGTGATHFIFSLPDEYWKKVTEFYASRRSCSGIGHLQIPRLQGNPWA